MDKNEDTILVEDKYFAPFFNKIKISIERGEGVYVWDENGRRYIDFTSGWGVTCIGHAHPVITQALWEQSSKIIQNPNSGLTYSPIRAKLLSLLKTIMPENIDRVFFTNSGAESNDAAIKLARRISGKLNVICSDNSFHGRTISTLSATGQTTHRDKFKPLMPNYLFVPYDDVNALKKLIGNDVAAVILEPIQGEGGVIIPSDDYFKRVSESCLSKNVFLIVDEIQTGFCRTGPFFVSDQPDVKVDFLTVAKGIAGGFPFGAFGMSEEIAKKIDIGDHGGTYCGNPLGCSVAYSVIKYLKDNVVGKNVIKRGNEILKILKKWRDKYPRMISDVRGKGLLIAIEISRKEIASDINIECLQRGLILNITHGNIIRIFPALNITSEEICEGLSILRNSIEKIAKNGG